MDMGLAYKAGLDAESHCVWKVDFQILFANPVINEVVLLRRAPFLHVCAATSSRGRGSVQNLQVGRPFAKEGLTGLRLQFQHH